MNNVKEWISDLEGRIMEITQSGQQKKKNNTFIETKKKRTKA